MSAPSIQSSGKGKRKNVAFTTAPAKAKSPPKVAKQTNPNKRRRTRVQSYATYIHKTLKQHHATLGIGKTAMSTMNSFTYDMFDRIATEASHICHRNKKKTLSVRAMKTATQLVLGGELAKHAISEGIRAITKYTSSRSLNEGPKRSKKGRVKGEKVISGSTRAGVIFPVGRTLRMLKTHNDRVSANAAVYLACVLQYMVTEVLSVAVSIVQKKKKESNYRSLY